MKKSSCCSVVLYNSQSNMTMTTMMLLVLATVSVVDAKMFANDPDIDPGQPEWSEWALTTVLPMVRGGAPTQHLDIDSGKLENVYYYYNDYSISSCAEPISGTPCISEMHFVGLPELKYVPYSVWNTFRNRGTKNKPRWMVRTWFNFNNTNTILVSSSMCNGSDRTSKMVHPIPLLDFSLTFNYTCKYDNEDGVDFKLVQETMVNGTFSSAVPLFAFTEWRPYTSIVKYAYNVKPEMTVQNSPPEDTPCKFC